MQPGGGPGFAGMHNMQPPQGTQQGGMMPPDAGMTTHGMGQQLPLPAPQQQGQQFQQGQQQPPMPPPAGAPPPTTDLAPPTPQRPLQLSDWVLFQYEEAFYSGDAITTRVKQNLADHAKPPKSLLSLHLLILFERAFFKIWVLATVASMIFKAGAVPTSPGFSRGRRITEEVVLLLLLCALNPTRLEVEGGFPTSWD